MVYLQPRKFRSISKPSVSPLLCTTIMRSSPLYSFVYIIVDFLEFRKSCLYHCPCQNHFCSRTDQAMKGNISRRLEKNRAPALLLLPPAPFLLLLLPRNASPRLLLLRRDKRMMMRKHPQRFNRSGSRKKAIINLPLS